MSWTGWGPIEARTGAVFAHHCTLAPALGPCFLNGERRPVLLHSQLFGVGMQRGGVREDSWVPGPVTWGHGDGD